MFEGMDRRFACYGWKVVKKLCQGLSAFEVVEERLKRNTSPTKNGRASE